LLLSPDLAKRLTNADVDKDVRGHESASDHAPVWVELADKARKARASPKSAPAEPYHAVKSSSGGEAITPCPKSEVFATSPPCQKWHSDAQHCAAIKRG
jgi:hypothetical protein